MGSRGLCLVIEDDQDIRELLTQILTRLDFDVHAVGNGAEGVAAAWQHDPVLVTVDLNLPDMDGIASGASAYLTKPFRPRQLTEIVNQVCPAGPLTAHRQDHRP